MNEADTLCFNYLNFKGTQMESTQVIIQSLTSPEAKLRIKSRNKQITSVKDIQQILKKLQRLIK